MQVWFYLSPRKNSDYLVLFYLSDANYLDALLNFFRFDAAGRPRKDAKDFQNVVNKTLFTHADHVKVSSVANVPGLHAMTGISGKLTDEIEKSFPDNKETHEGTDFVNKFLKQHNIHRAEYQGSHSFEGNHARKLLRVAHEMRPAVEQLSGDQEITTLRGSSESSR